ncbi:mRNA-capping enzyme isoform X2 [Selaginella moellendorffii]|nr:mRNA-capping enzyme isoform X2 [Selaginella moellendorffii]|eukprot:XP_002974489.2 mRNA-capping enzyme isoform X2 [Selaginella moellendorffii]
MDLNVLPEETEEEEECQVALQEEIEAAAEENPEEEEAAEEDGRVETGVETYRREREERRARLKRKLENASIQPEKPRRAPAAPAPPPPQQQYAASSIPLIPKGWIDCPPFGEPVLRFVPSKVFLGEAYNAAIEPGKRYSWKRILRQHKDVGLIIDLTNTTRYYSANEVTRAGLSHFKIPCKGRNEVPDAEAVNTFVYETHRYLQRSKTSRVLVHCTHGFNRTGYMIVNYLVRYCGLPVTQALAKFAAARPPGIYKKSYIRKLYALYHDPTPFAAPAVPDWKRLDLNGTVDDDDGDDEEDDPTLDRQENAAPMTNDDVLGDAISSEEQIELQRLCLSLLDLASQSRNLSFPGSHPVSLDRSKLQLLKQHYYFATWKADGTRYMMLILSYGCYLIDRKFEFRRIQMRFPHPRKDSPLPVHHMTLLDGEMVIDKHPETGKLERRYLIYDMMVVNAESLVKKPFSQRFHGIESDVIRPRHNDAGSSGYLYKDEEFRVRRKNFWPLSSTKLLFQKLIPGLSHRSDGLIFQGFEMPYVCRTSDSLLKWKFPSLNSVDFYLQRSGDTFTLSLLEKGNHQVLPGASVSFDDSVDPSTLENKVIECSWNNERQSWEFMRLRPDKPLANAFNTYRKVFNSIKDNITQEELVEEIDRTVKLPMYKEKDKQFLK